MIFEIQETIFPNKLKPLKPQPNYDITITILLIAFLIVRISSIIFTFIYTNFLIVYSNMVKFEVLTLSNPNNDILPIKNNENSLYNKDKLNIKLKIKDNHYDYDNDREKHLLKIGTIKSLNNPNSCSNSEDADYNDSILGDKYLQEDMEPIMRLDMDEINKKIKSGDIFVDRNSEYVITK
jgi:hypothetical protein